MLRLVRNAYDADAKRCTVKLERVTSPGGSIIVIDNGHGMTPAEIEHSWLILGHGNKREQRRTPAGRRLVGEKGLGRLAALRMGEVARLRTRPVSRPGREFRLRIAWADFDGAEAVEDVELKITEHATAESPGTTIELESLRQKLNERDLSRLARTLVLLSDPFRSTREFRAELLVPEFREVERTVKASYFDEAEYQLSARLNARGRATATLTDWRGKELAKADHRRLAQDREGAAAYGAPPAKFELWAFSLSRVSFDVRKSNIAVGAVRDWLDAVGGVHLYHRKLRVAPYGDPGVDWLEMNLRRVRSPEMRPSTNTSMGRVVVDDDDRDLLRAKTDRTGLIENDAFDELRSFCVDVLEWAAAERLRLRDEALSARRRNADTAVQEARDNLDVSLRQVATTERRDVAAAATKLVTAVDAQVLALEEELLLYRTMSTVGTTTAVFAHEVLRPVETIESMAKSIRSRGRKALGEGYETTIGEPVEHLEAAAASLRTFSQLPLRLLRKNKRRAQQVDVHDTIKGLVTLLAPALDATEVGVELDFAPTPALIRSSVAAVEAVVANLLVNSAYSLVHASEAQARRVVIRTRLSRGRLLLSVLDNGAGIRKLTIDEVWTPGRTTRPGGTGLGLTIVRDVVASLGGTASAIAKGELGGAEFVIELPMEESGS